MIDMREYWPLKECVQPCIKPYHVLSLPVQRGLDWGTAGLDGLQDSKTANYEHCMTICYSTWTAGLVATSIFLTAWWPLKGPADVCKQIAEIIIVMSYICVARHHTFCTVHRLGLSAKIMTV